MTDNLSPLATVREAVANTLGLPDDDMLAIDYIVSIVISNVWTPDADPLWGWIIAPPGSYKTEILRTLEGYKCIHYLSSLSQCALVSGYDNGNDEDMSLLPSLHRKVLTIKDFTAILSQPDTTIRQIFGDLRDAYDGNYAKHYGTVGERRFVSKFGILAAVTPAIDQYVHQHVILGERFLALRLCKTLRTRPNARMAMLRHVRKAMSDKASWRTNLSALVQSSITAALSNVPSDITIPDEYDEQIICLADLVANLRALPAIVKAREEQHTPDTAPELGSRLVNQLANLALARCVADGRDAIDDTDMALLRRVAHDTLPPLAALVAGALNDSPPSEYQHVHETSKRTGVPVKHLNRVLQQYQGAGITETTGAANDQAANWRLTRHARVLCDVSGMFTTTSSETSYVPVP